MPKNKTPPLLNPIITLLKPPIPEAIHGGGKSRKDIVISRLSEQRASLSGKISKIIENSEKITKHGGKFHVLSSMHPDSLAPSYTPDSLFSPKTSTRIIAPAYNGYLIEVNENSLRKLKNKIEQSTTVNDLVDITRIQDIKTYDINCTLRNKELNDFWEESWDLDCFQFNIWLMPYHDSKSKNSVIDTLLSLYQNERFIFGHPDFDIENTNEDNFRLNPSGKTIPPSLVNTIRRYQRSGNGSLTITIETKSDLKKILESSTIYRIDPVSPLSVTDTPPGNGQEPTPPTSIINTLPSVVVVDGGCNAKSYAGLNIHKITPLIPDHDADCKHGNKVVSIICHGYAWNNNLILPQLQCSYISAQAIAKRSATKQPSPDQFLNYLRKVAIETHSKTKVWNLSFNESLPNFNSSEISYLGHKINELARQFDFLPIISIGNVSTENPDKLLCPPADCESALTVSGRLATAQGTPSNGCPYSLKGPAPAGMKKPELSWFSHLRVLGGAYEIGTSFSAPLISSLAAHTFANIKNPTPDLVRALLINRSELLSHNDNLGWGSPWHGDSLPWHCKDGSVTLTWVSKLKPGAAYYWNDIPLPPEMLKNGKLAGEISLTAILRPLTSELGSENYFSTRLQCSLQSIKKDGDKLKTKSLLGSMKESTTEELTSRLELSKWSPIRHHAKSFKSVDITDQSIRLYARIYTRDLYQFDLTNQQEVEEQEVSFVLTFKSLTNSPDIYSSMTQKLGVYVESAVIDNQININI
ncbi:TPA: S8 family peptidase [Klebsiella michiganensis]